jgi:hypothetical protein
MDGHKRKKTMRIIAAVGGAALVALALAWPALRAHMQSAPPQNDMTVDKAVRNEAIEAAISNLNKYYVFAEQAAALEKQLRRQMQDGDFDSLSSAETFARKLTEALQRDTRDKHLEVRYVEKAVPQGESGEASADDKAAELLHGQRFNFGFAAFTRLRGNIGYVELRAFGRPEHAAERIAATMTLIADTKALIVDLRRCDGGDPETVMLFASYLFDKRTHLNDIYWRYEDRTEERWTSETVPGQRYGEARKVYLLTSRETFSGCEDFAYALKNNRRATLIGETTGGGAHAGDPHRLGAHFMMFVPSGRPISPVTHTDWEAVGVAPDVEASPKNALDVAQIAALKHLIAAETDLDWKAGLERRIAELD